MIDLHRRDSRDSRIRVDGKKIVDQRVAGGQRHVAENRGDNWVDPSRGNGVIGKWIALPQSVDGLIGLGIVNRVFKNRTAQRVRAKIAIRERAGEVSVAIVLRRHGKRFVVGDGSFAELLEIEKEKRFVMPVVHLGNPHRPSERESVVVAALAWTQQMSISIARKWNAGI